MTWSDVHGKQWFLKLGVCAARSPTTTDRRFQANIMSWATTVPTRSTRHGHLPRPSTPTETLPPILRLRPKRRRPDAHESRDLPQVWATAVGAIRMDGRHPTPGHLWMPKWLHHDHLNGVDLMPAIYPTLPCCGCTVPHCKPPQHLDGCWTLRGLGVEL